MTAFNRLSEPRRPSGFVPRESESLSFRHCKQRILIFAVLLLGFFLSKQLGMIFKPVRFGYLARNSARISECKTICRNVAGNDGSRTYDATFTDSYSRANGNVARYPAIVAYRYRRAVFFIGSSAGFFIEIRISVLPTERVLRCEKRNVWTYENIFTNGYFAYIKCGEIEVGKAVLAHFYICTALS